MQSLQIRWPVPGHMGLSTTIIAKAAMESPCFLKLCASEIFSSRGQPANLMPKGFLLREFVFLSTKPFEQESFSLS